MKQGKEHEFQPLIAFTRKGTAISSGDGQVTLRGAHITADGSTAIRAGVDLSGRSPAGLTITSRYSTLPKDIYINANGGMAVDSTDGYFNIGSTISDTIGKVEVYGDIKIGGDDYLNPRRSSLMVSGGGVWQGTVFDTSKAQNGLLELDLGEEAKWVHETKQENLPGEAYLSTLAAMNPSGWGSTGPTVTNAYIFQNSERNIHVKNLSGFKEATLNIFYQHDKTDPTKIKGGTFTVDSVSSSTGSVRALTDSDGIDMNNKAVVSGVLSSLANKLIYSATVQQVMTGKVAIADGLTTSSALLKDTYIQFDENGVGQYRPQTVFSFDVPIRANETLDTPYVDNGVYVGISRTTSSTLYALNGDTAIQVTNPAYAGAIDLENVANRVDLDGQGNNLTLSGPQAGIYIKNDTDSNRITNMITTRNLPTLTALSPAEKGTAAVVIDGGVGYFQGTFNGNNQTTTLKVRPRDGKTGAVGFVMKDSREKPFGTLMLQQINVDADLPGGTVFLVNGGDIVNANNDYTTTRLKAEGGNLLKVTGPTAGITLSAQEMVGDVDLSEAETNGRKQIQIRMNATKDQPATWTGGLIPDKDKSITTIVRFLNKMNGYTTTNPVEWIYSWNQPDKEQDSYVKYVEGISGPVTGVINMKADTNLEIGTLSDGLRIYYNHDAANPTSIKGGNVTIDNSDSGNLYVRTDNTGIDMTNTNQVASVLNALANKIYYLAGDGKMTSTAEIAEGLTSVSAIKTGTMKFNETTHQGYLEGGPQDPVQAETDFIVPLYSPTGKSDDASNAAYINNGILQVPLFIFKETLIK